MLIRLYSLGYVFFAKKHRSELNLSNIFTYCYNNFDSNLMLNEDSQQGEMNLKLYSKTSQCSTSIYFAPYYEEFFYLGADESPQNIVKIQLSQENILYEHKRIKKSVLLSLTTLEQSIYLRDQKAVFAIKLTRNTQKVTFSTFEKDKFVCLYLHLAKHCILTSFEKHYRVGKLFGTGAFGNVYNGYNLISNENVALKVISKDKIQKTDNGMKMLHNQIQILQKLRNYHISPLISTYETSDCFILVLQKGSGGNLLDYIHTQEQNYGEKMLKTILKQVLQNVSLIHEAGFIHRDIKPENIICKDSSNPSIFLCDYGISIRKSRMNFDQKEENLSGTIGFIAPQIIKEEDFDEKCDIFSIGCVFFYLFTGKKLFETKNFFQLKMMVRNSNYVVKRLEFLANISFEIRDLIEKMLQFNPEQRFSANQALRHSLFKDTDVFVPNLGQFDDTLRDFILNKISNYWY